MQGMRFQSLVGELRYHVPRGQKPKHKTEEYCNKFNKDSQNWSTTEKHLKKKKKVPVNPANHWISGWP